MSKLNIAPHRLPRLYSLLTSKIVALTTETSDTRQVNQRYPIVGPNAGQKMEHVPVLTVELQISNLLAVSE
ncbi:hypothetical protein T265_04984 [Opisthorchis viverrini]|uniref:Uncharacterized protein n=1 Tax=Opisthorchis viverrini TaxID=6198 RepID=A0A075AFX5_OPIVI|nr:hypothetical protein T265_04984 [Opisthorchis viverrini]KER28154.1 hypothetical protein T265_04984 [Opisthorchis viverrini]